MLIYPAIDLINGECVRLTKGNFEERQNYQVSPLEKALSYEKAGSKFLHIIDLDAAKTGSLQNLKIIKEIAAKTNLFLQVGGGIRSEEVVKTLFDAGVNRLIIGTSIIKNPTEVASWLKKYGSEKFAAGLDFKNGEICINGWQKSIDSSFEKYFDLVKVLGFQTIIATDITKDGMLSGPNLEFVKKVPKYFDLIIAGGVTDLKDLKNLKSQGVKGAVIGKALYETDLDLEEVLKTVQKNNLRKRVIPCLDMKDGRVVKGTKFVDLKDSGDAVELAAKYSKEQADELVFLDISATVEKRKNLKSLVEKVAKAVNIPFTVGGGIKSCEDINDLLRAGADKVSIGSYAAKNPEFIREASKQFGSQCLVISVDAKKVEGKYYLAINGGSKLTDILVKEFVKTMEEMGAGELLVNSLDRDGTKEGYDLELLKMVKDSVKIPVIASSGAGKIEDFSEVIEKANVDAVLAASLFHENKLKVLDVKKVINEN
jgi:cyclase